MMAESAAICEYIEETRPEPPLMPTDPAARFEVRRLVGWFDRKFNTEVTENLVTEKMMKRFLGLGEIRDAVVPKAAAVFEPRPQRQPE